MQDNQPSRPLCRTPPLQAGEAPCELVTDHVVSQPRPTEVFPTMVHPEGPSSMYLRQMVGGGGEAFGSLPSEPSVGFPSDELPRSFLSSIDSGVPQNTFTHTLLQSILASIDSKDPVLANAWLETLLDVIDLLPKDVIQKDIVTLAVNKGQLSQPVSSRLAACKLLGKVATKFEPYIIRKEIIPLMQSLCQDIDYQVRGCMCKQLHQVARGIGLETTRSAILPELVELCKDEESWVRLAGIETVGKMLPLLDPETCLNTITPLVEKVCESALRTEDVTLPLVARQLGNMVHGLGSNLSETQKLRFLQFYRQMARLGLSHHRNTSVPDLLATVPNEERYLPCRQSCAMNLPVMVAFAESHNFQEQLYPTLIELSRDLNHIVRYTIASNFHEVMGLLSGCISLVIPELISLLRDSSLEVVSGLIVNLPVIIELLSKDPSVGNVKEMELTEGILAMEELCASHTNWRLHVHLLSGLSSLPSLLHTSVLQAAYVPLLFHRAKTARPIPCREAAARTLLLITNTSQNQQLTNSVLTRFIQEDKVPNIRLRLCTMLASLKALLALPDDRRLLQLLESKVASLLAGEQDRDVQQALRVAIDELDRIELPLNVGYGLDLGVPTQYSSETKSFMREYRYSSDSRRTSLFLGTVDRKSSIPLLQGENPNPAPVSSSSKQGSSCLPLCGEDIISTFTGSLPNLLFHDGLLTNSQRGGGTNAIPRSGFPVYHRSWSLPSYSFRELPPTPIVNDNQFVASPYSPETIDPSTDEFLIDAGVRIEPSALKPVKTQQYLKSKSPLRSSRSPVRNGQEFRTSTRSSFSPSRASERTPSSCQSDIAQRPDMLSGGSHPEVKFRKQDRSSLPKSNLRPPSGNYESLLRNKDRKSINKEYRKSMGDFEPTSLEKLGQHSPISLQAMRSPRIAAENIEETGSESKESGSLSLKSLSPGSARKPPLDTSAKSGIMASHLRKSQTAYKAVTLPKSNHSRGLRFRQTGSSESLEAVKHPSNLSPASTLNRVNKTLQSLSIAGSESKKIGVLSSLSGLQAGNKSLSDESIRFTSSKLKPPSGYSRVKGTMSETSSPKSQSRNSSPSSSRTSSRSSSPDTSTIDSSSRPRRPPTRSTRLAFSGATSRRSQSPSLPNPRILTSPKLSRSDAKITSFSDAGSSSIVRTGTETSTGKREERAWRRLSGSHLKAGNSIDAHILKADEDAGRSHQRQGSSSDTTKKEVNAIRRHSYQRQGSSTDAKKEENPTRRHGHQRQGGSSDASNLNKGDNAGRRLSGSHQRQGISSDASNVKKEENADRKLSGSQQRQGSSRLPTPNTSKFSYLVRLEGGYGNSWMGKEMPYWCREPTSAPTRAHFLVFLYMHNKLHVKPSLCVL